jgi:hypothetical protein
MVKVLSFGHLSQTGCTNKGENEMNGKEFWIKMRPSVVLVATLILGLLFGTTLALAGGTKPPTTIPAWKQTVADCVTGDHFVEGTVGNEPDPGCDNWYYDLYERPYNNSDHDHYYADQDLVKVKATDDTNWWYFWIELYGIFDEELDEMYGIEADVDGDGCTDWYWTSDAPTQNLRDKVGYNQWGQDGVIAYYDQDSDVGGAHCFEPDAGWSGSGYEEKVSDQGGGDDPDGIWAMSPSGVNDKVVIIAVQKSMIASKNSQQVPDTIWWRGWAESGVQDNANYHHHDKYANSEAGDAYQSWPEWPTQNVYEDDTTDLSKFSPDCEECDGGVTYLKLKYMGTEYSALIQVYEGKDQRPDKKLFEGTVGSGGTFSFNGIKSDGTMGKEISVWVNGTLHTKIHTSCSKPIGPGLVSGDFKVIEGQSKDGGELCPLPECMECDGGVTKLTLHYNGDSAALVQVYKGDDQDEDKKLYEGTAGSGETFTFTGQDSDNKMGSEISVWVNGVLNAEIHTSCSQPIGPGLVRGDFEVVEGYSKDGGKLCPLPECMECKGGVTQLTLLYNGAEDDVLIQVYEGKDQRADKLLYEDTLDLGEAFTFNGIKSDGTMGTEISVWVGGVLKTKIHTSCSQDIGPGLVSGDFEVVEGYSKDGGKMCSLCEIGDRVWHDEDGYGDQNENCVGSICVPEPGLNDVDIYLYDFAPGTCGAAGYLHRTSTISGTSQTPDGFPDGIYGFDMHSLGLGTGTYWVCVDESTLPPATYGWDSTTGNNPQQVSYTAGTDDFSIDFGYEPGSGPTVVALSFFAAKSSAGGSASGLWPGLVGLAVVAAGSLFWAKRRAG